MVNQSGIDLCACVVSLMSEYFNSFDMMPENYGILRNFYCTFWLSTYIIWSLCCSSVYNLMFLTIERFYAITKPMQYNPDAVYKRLPFILTTAWLSGFALSFMVAMFFEIVDGQCALTVIYRYPTLFKSMTPYYIIALVMIPSTVMIFAYVKMGLFLASSQFSSKGHRIAQKNLFQTCLILMLVFVATGFNHCVSLVMYYIGYYPDSSNDQYQISAALVILNSCINPYVYCIRYRDFQQQVKHLLGCSSETTQSSRSISKAESVQNTAISKSDLKV